MRDLETANSAAIHNDDRNEPTELAQAKPRDTRSWKTLYEGLQTRVNTALMLLPAIKVEKGSQDTMNAVQGLLKGNQ